MTMPAKSQLITIGREAYNGSDGAPTREVSQPDRIALAQQRSGPQRTDDEQMLCGFDGLRRAEHLPRRHTRGLRDYLPEGLILGVPPCDRRRRRSSQRRAVRAVYRAMSCQALCSGGVASRRVVAALNRGPGPAFANRVRCQLMLICA